MMRLLFGAVHQIIASEEELGYVAAIVMDQIKFTTWVKILEAV